MTFYLVWFLISADGHWVGRSITMASIEACNAEKHKLPASHCVVALSR